MLRLLFISFTFLFFCNTSAFALDALFLEKAQVSNSIVRLGDIVHFSEMNEEVRVLQSKKIGNAPGIGAELILKRNHILRQLASENPLPPEIRWSGAEAIHITLKESIISSSTVQEIITNYLQEKSDILPNIEFIFTPAELPTSFKLPPGTLTTEVTSSKQGIIGSNRFSITFRVNGKLKKNLSIRGTLQSLVPVYVAQDDISRGSELTTDLFSVETRDINSVKKPLLASESLANKQVVRRLRKGDILTFSQVESIPLVYRGDTVQVRLNSNGLTITMTGIARADGGLNDMIRVQNTSSNKVFYAKVLAPGLVEVRI